jgi:aminotransferase in exopolysaccharide biosynthesis
MHQASLLANEITEAIRAVTGSGACALHEPSFQGKEWAYVRECLDSTFVSSVGAFVDRFEADLARYTGAKHAIAVSNGTAALHVSLLLAGVQTGDEVLVPALTFVATANAVRYCQASPHFVDSEARTLGVDAVRLDAYLGEISTQREGQCVNLATGKVIRALIVMHVFGHPCELDALLKVAQKHHIALVEDAAEALGSWYGECHVGTFGLLGALSFNGNKIITTGGGGAILTNDTALAKRAKHLTTTAKLPHRWAYEHDEVGFNYRMPNLNAALGCAQLEMMPSFLSQKRALHARYAAQFQKVQGVRLVSEPSGCTSNYWLQALQLEQAQAGNRDHLLDVLNAAGISARPVWKLMHQLQPFEACPRMNLRQAQALEQQLINIPSSASLGTLESVDDVP